MNETVAQPNAAPLAEELLDRVLDTIRPELNGAVPLESTFRDGHSNDVTEIAFSNGRTLMVKRGRYEWSADRFEASRRAAYLLRDEARILAPDPLPLPSEISERPIEAYWRIDLPTLEELWPTIPEARREDVYWSWGALVRRVHEIEVDGFGPLARSGEGAETLELHLEQDLRERLKPAVTGEWSEGLPLVENLLDALPELGSRFDRAGSALLHNDLHMGNILCETEGDEIRCVGLLDLEGAQAGPPEADLANLEVMHGPHFARPLPPRWFDWIVEGYGSRLDLWGRAFFKVYHLLNMGFYSALVGHREHAAVVAEAARSELRRVSSNPAGPLPVVA